MSCCVMPLWIELNINLVASQMFSVLFLKKTSGIENVNVLEMSGTLYLDFISAVNLYFENNDNDFFSCNKQNITRWLKRGRNFQIVICHYRIQCSQRTVFPVSHFIVSLSNFNAVISFKMCSILWFSEVGHVLIIAFVFRCVTY